MRDPYYKLLYISESIRKMAKFCHKNKDEEMSFRLTAWATQLDKISFTNGNLETIAWHTEPPKENGRYLVTVFDEKIIVGTDNFNVERGEFLSFGKRVKAWAYFPNPFFGHN